MIMRLSEKHYSGFSRCNSGEMAFGTVHSLHKTNPRRYMTKTLRIIVLLVLSLLALTHRARSQGEQIKHVHSSEWESEQSNQCS